MIRKLLALSLTSTLVISGCSTGLSSNPPGNGNANTTPPVTITPTTPSAAIKHVVVIFGENISFDHYFGTYPNASNPAGETAFTPAAGTPTNIANYISTPALLTANPNLASNGTKNTTAIRLPNLRWSVKPVPPRSRSGRHQRPEPRLRPGTVGL